jgi:DNA-binding transcriptional MerR regulator
VTKIVVVRNPIIYRIKDLARDFYVTPRTVRRWVTDGMLKPRGYRRIGGSALELIFTADEIERFLDVYLIRPEDFDWETPTPRGKEARAAQVARLIGTSRMLAGKASAARMEKLLKSKE